MRPDPGNAEKLPRGLLIFYALPHLSHAVVTWPMALFIPAFYAEDLGLPLAAVGAAIAASRILDVITDPLIGIASDSWHLPWGRRKPWLVVGTPLLMLAIWMVFVPPAGISISYLLFWSCLLYLGFTLADLPYKVWGAELSTTYAERSRVTAWREALGVIGQIFFLSLMVLMGIWGHDTAREQLLAVAGFLMLCMPILVGLALWKVPEGRAVLRDEHHGPRGLKALAIVYHNKPFLRTLAAILLFATAVIIQATLHRLVLIHVFHRPELFAPMILVENCAALLVLPLWLALSDRIGKHRAVTLAALWVGIISLAFPLLGPDDSGIYVFLIVLRGSSFASIFFLSNSIAADVLDEDRVHAERERGGLYFAIWGMAMKLAVAIGLVLATALPAAFGFDPATGQHGESALFALMLIYGWLPALIMACAAPILWNFPLDEARQKLLRGRLAARNIE